MDRGGGFGLSKKAKNVPDDSTSRYKGIQFNSVYFQHTLTFHTISTTSTLCAGKGADRRQCL